MTQFIEPLISQGFATGVTSYQDYYPGQEQFARMVLPVVLAGSLTVQAVVDTGAPWCIFDPDIIEASDAAEATGYVPEVRLQVRGT